MNSPILDLSEVWALLIPLAIILFKSKGPAYLRPVRYYVYAALFINVCIIAIQEFKEKWWGLHEGDFFWTNNYFYNISLRLKK